MTASTLLGQGEDGGAGLDLGVLETTNLITDNQVPGHKAILVKRLDQHLVGDDQHQTQSCVVTSEYSNLKLII